MPYISYSLLIDLFLRFYFLYYYCSLFICESFYSYFSLSIVSCFCIDSLYLFTCSRKCNFFYCSSACQFPISAFTSSTRICFLLFSNLSSVYFSSLRA